MALDRRELIKALSATGFIALGTGSVINQVINSLNLPKTMLDEAQKSLLLGKNLPILGESELDKTGQKSPSDLNSQAEPIEEIATAQTPMHETHTHIHNAENISEKSKNFEEVFSDDYFLTPNKLEILKSAHEKLHQVQLYVGYANFNLLTIDEAFNLAKTNPQISEFSTPEKELLEEIFTTDAKKYGFYGKRVQTSFTQKPITSTQVVKIPRTGHFLYKESSNNFYQRLLKDVGPSLVLTSGIRTLAKQSYLFSTKALQSQGNLSKASRSVAPPGYSYHAVGDFDVGKVGFGYKNFTSAFAKTREYQKIAKLEYVDIRYKPENMLGVRYEPWHITTV